LGLSDELRAGVGPIWEKVVTHPFVTEMADGSLDRSRFDIYFDQDYLFLKDWSILLSLATAKAPDFDAARELVSFLHLGLGGEEGLFQEAFRERGISREWVKALEYLPTTHNYSGYLRTQAYESTFTEVVATLLAVEWPYLDWAARADDAGRKPDNHYYQTWINIHTSPGMSGFVSWLRSVVDGSAPTPELRAKLQEIFRSVLRYEYQFFDMAYRGEKWSA
jgi:thiaminase/transcriptional activator TenA|tara:strand:+ start:18519 stop:19181 length:663 start_codon:yes stop_codon:yes gene_type:complete